MIFSNRFRLIGALLVTCLLVGGLSLVVGVRLLNKAVFNEASNRIRLDLNAARVIYGEVVGRVQLALEMTADEEGYQWASRADSMDELSRKLDMLVKKAGMDFAGYVDTTGETVIRYGNSGVGEDQNNPAALHCLANRSVVSGTVILEAETLEAENPALATRARTIFVPTERAMPRSEAEETAGMTICSAVPVYEGNTLVGALYGGVLLNRDCSIVDRIKETVFQNEIYQGRDIGTVTIFHNDLRIATNVFTATGERAVGTRVSEEVRETVLSKGARWTDRAFVVNEWYITAYEPIVDIFGERVGILYVGILEDKYVDIRKNTILTFVLITSSGMLLAIALGFFFSQRILKPVQLLIEASRRVSHGDLSPEIGPVSTSEIGVLQRTFTDMVKSLKARDKFLKAESERKLLQSEKQASVGRLAAGVAHEINNPLTGVVTFTHMLLRRKDLPEGVREDLDTIAAATDRVRKIVKGLLDFSRQSELEPELTGINELINETIPLVANQALVKGVIFCFNPGKDIPLRILDRNQFQSVILNILINALDATDYGGHININSRLVFAAGENQTRGIEIQISDTGHGISPENLDKLFDPFFTTKEVGEGTGLGLSVSQGIVERHRGTIRVQSTVGEGTMFTIWLPMENGEEQ